MYAVSQLGARMHYAVPRMLDEAGLLHSLFTDLAFGPVASRVLGRKSERYAPSLSHARLHSRNVYGLLVKLARSSGDYARVRSTERRLLGLIERDFERQAAAGHFTTLYAFDTEAAGMFSIAMRHGIGRTLEQCVAPRSAQIALYDRLAQAGVFTANAAHYRHLHFLGEREEAEWERADRIIAPSAFVRDEMIKTGCPADRIRLVPYGYANGPADGAMPGSFDGRRPLRIIFAGRVGARKGAHDVIALARHFGDRVTIHLYGGGSLAEVAASAPDNIVHHGAVDFATLQDAYRRADLLVLPSYLEGSATVVYEGLSHGLPSLVTHQTGSVISDGLDGFVVEAGDVEAMIERLDNLLTDPGKIEAMSVAALETSRRYTCLEYRRRLFSALDLPETRP